MDMRVANAALAYARALNNPVTPGDAAASPSGFAALVENALGNAADASRASEAATVQTINGKAELADVVAAVTNAEVALETVVAIRDRVINAYQEIIRMPL